MDTATLNKLVESIGVTLGLECRLMDEYDRVPGLIYPVDGHDCEISFRPVEYGAQRGRIKVHGHPASTLREYVNRDLYPGSITVDGQKSPSRMADDIRRRLMPKIAACARDAIARKAAIAAYETRVIDLAARIETATGGRVTAGPSPWGSAKTRQLYSSDPHISGQVYDGAVTIERWSLPADLAIKVLTLVYGQG